MKSFSSQNMITWWKQTSAINSKDFRQIILSPMFLVILGMCCCLWSLNYFQYIISFARVSISNPYSIYHTVFQHHIYNVNLLLIFIIPAITMRVFSGEYKDKTFDLLLSSPLSSTQIIIGKFLATYRAVFVIIVVSFSYIAMTRFFADFNWVDPLSAYLGLMMVSAIYTACGMFASSLTSSAILSTVLGLIFNLFLWFISQFKGSSENEKLTAIFEYLPLPEHFLNFMKGTVVLSSVSYFLCFTLFFIFLTRQVIETIRWR